MDESQDPEWTTPKGYHFMIPDDSNLNAPSHLAFHGEGENMPLFIAKGASSHNYRQLSLFIVCDDGHKQLFLSITPNSNA